METVSCATAPPPGNVIICTYRWGLELRNGRLFLSRCFIEGVTKLLYLLHRSE